MKILYGQGLVNELRRKADTVSKRLWIAVPYIGGINSVRRIIGNSWIGNSSLSIRLLADISEFNNLNSETIKHFYQFGTVKHLVGLHAKIYIIDSSCLVTSANLTETAFAKRHEIGVFLDEENSAKIIAVFTSWWNNAEEVSSITIKKYANKKSKSSEEVSGSALKTLWDLPTDNEEIKYWLKPIGATDDPVKDTRRFDNEMDNLHFSVRKPTGVNPIDIFITYGVGAKKILSFYKKAS
jgi:phosphatidylserine/phosphatidylglycerophosphate/cardiolipin synthase-like enzyme